MAPASCCGVDLAKGQIHTICIGRVRLSVAIALKAQIPSQAHHEVLYAIVAAPPEKQ